MAPLLRRTVHQTLISAPADTVYAMLAEVEHWPRIFPPTVWAERLESSGRDERIRLWATTNDRVASWTSRRRLDPAARRVEFRQEVSQPPVGSMGGSWSVREAPGESCQVVLEHDYTAVDDAPDSVDWIERALERNSESELAALKRTAENGGARSELLLSFQDTVEVAGSAPDVYAFIRDGEAWAERLPHVARVELTEEVPDLQILEMDTRTADGSTHTTRSVRVCFPHRLIAYKQLLLPKLLSAHTGRWLIRDQEAGCVALTSAHTAVIDRGAIAEVLGPGASVADARAYVRTALGGNSRTTMSHAKAYAERLSPAPRV
jgi:aromatase